MRKVYLDANATTMIHPEAKKAMLPLLGEAYGNASSVHSFGREAKRYLESAREKIAAFIQAEAKDEIVFTSGGTEADNFAIKGIAQAFKDKGNHIITSSVEHPAVLNTCKYLETQGVRVTYLGVDQYGEIDLDELKKSITDETILITIMAANNETGTIMPVKDIGKIAARKNIVFHTDAVQMIGKMPFNAEESGARLISISAHKINGPKGIGALYIKKGTPIKPYQHGGHHERGRRAGTENIPSIAGFAKACEIAGMNLEEHSNAIKEKRDLFYSRIKAEIKQVRLNGHPEKRLCNTINLGFDYLEGEAIVLSLDMEGIAVSTGSACTSGTTEPSHVLINMGIDRVFAQGAVRFSLDRFTTKEEIEYVIKKLPPIIERLREISPLR
ncbi:MAG: cysteine desulfurase NifS [Candidatus Omnitrophota bacterium]